MRVTAKRWVKYHENWYQAGETFDVNETDLTGMAEAVESIAEPQPSEPVGAEKPKRVRKARKTEE